MTTDYNQVNNSLYVKKYTTAMDMALQQKTSLLKETVTTSTADNAELLQAIVYYGKTTLKPVVGINNPITHSSLAYTQRWLRGKSFEDAQLLNKFTQLDFMEQSPEMAIVQAQAAAIARKYDEVILQAVFASALTGTDGGSTTAYDTNNTVSVSEGAAAATGLNIAKLRKVLRLAKAKEIDLNEEPLYMPITEIQNDNLTGQIEATNEDFRVSHAVVRGERGEIKSILGINLIHMSSTTLGTYTDGGNLLDGSSYRRLPVYTKKGLNLAIWRGGDMSIDKVVTTSGQPNQFYCKMNIGATRTDESRVFEIKCAEIGV